MPASTGIERVVTVSKPGSFTGIFAPVESIDVHTVNQGQAVRRAACHICVVLCGLLVAASTALAQLPSLELSLPVEGELGKDVYIINYVDHESDSGAIRDYMCGRQTYDGHDGTDFAVKSFRHMDSGVHVIAAAPGRVVAVVDTLYDRNKRVDRSLGFGNYVAVELPGGYILYYAHLKRSSARVKVGESVKTGQRLGLIGSSGTSEDPHLHFEVWQRIDAFQGACLPRPLKWQEQPAYQTEYALIDADVTTWPPSLDTIREHPPRASSITKGDSSITFWSLQQHIAVNDQLSATWLTPDGATWFTYEFTVTDPSTYYYWWTWIRRPEASGQWKVEYRRNGDLVVTRSFNVEATVSVGEPPRQGASLRRMGDVLRCEVDNPGTLSVYDLQGRLLQRSSVPAGTSAHMVPFKTPVIIDLSDERGSVMKTMALP